MKARLGRWVRWGGLATTVAMGAILVATAWIGLERATAAATTLNLGQGEVLLEAARQTLRGAILPLKPALLDSLLRRHWSAGLRFVAVLDTSGGPIAQAGTASAPLPQPVAGPRTPPAALAPVGGRLRMVSGGRVGPPPPPDSGASRARIRPQLVVLEFEPVVARRLAAEETRTFALSAVMAAALLAAALLFWRLTLRQEATERRLEQQRRLGALGEMSAVLAHEIRNPLASLKGHAQLLVERLASGGADRLKAELVVKEAQRLEALTSDLLDFARSGPVERNKVDPAALVRSCADEVGAGAFAVRTEGAPGTFPLDERRVRQALTNVLQNARQASREGTRPEVTLSSEGGALMVAVRDFGLGIPAGDEKRIFSPFYTTRTTGTGLGLAVALRVAEMHGGTVTAENHPGGGAVFRLTFRAG